nr:MAG TPA_asm: hypothetical protein [Caudoviricetes sp.]
MPKADSSQGGRRPVPVPHLRVNYKDTTNFSHISHENLHINPDNRASA